MFCAQCGKEISGVARFCPHCGAVIAASALDPEFMQDPASAPNPGATPDPASAPESAAGTGPYTYSYGAAPSYSAGVGGSDPASPPAPPQDTEKRGKKGLFIGGAVAAVAVVAAVVFMFVSGVFSSPKGRVEAAFAKTIAAYSSANEGMGLSDVRELTQSKSVSQNFSMELNSVNSDLIGYDLSSLQGLGLRFSSGCDWNTRYLGSEVAAFWGDNELCSFLMAVNNNVLSAASPQFTGGEAYGLDTETIGKAMVRWGMDPGDERLKVEDIGFNLFDLAEETVPSQQSEEMKQQLKDAAKKLVDAMKVEKAGKKTIEVNGNSVNAAAYLVIVPQEAMEDYIDALSDAMALVDSREQSRKLLRAIGLDEDTTEYALSDMSGVDPYGQAFDALKQALQEIGDLELDVYLDGGYVCAVEYSKEQNGSKLELGVYMGGGDSYVDDFSLKIALDGDELLVESTGNHGGKDGVFTDATTLRARSGGSTLFRLSSNFSYEPKAKANNFEWRLNVNNMFSVKTAGQLTAGKDSFSLHLDDVSLTTVGMEICSLSMNYDLSPFQSSTRVFLPNPTLLGDMDLDDLEDLYYDIEYYAQEWMYDMMALIPEDLFWAFY